MKEFYMTLIAGKIIDALNAMSLNELRQIVSNGNFDNELEKLTAKYWSFVKAAMSACNFTKDDISIIVATAVSYIDSPKRVYLIPHIKMLEEKIFLMLEKASTQIQ